MEEKNNKRILIIDDEQEFVFSLSILLKAKGFNVTAAYDGLFGLSIAHKGDIDLILLDLSLPAGGGFYVLEHLKKSSNLNHVPVVVVTANQDKETEEIVMRMGAVAYLRKPFEPEELLATINAHLL